MDYDRIFERWSTSFEKWRVHMFQSLDPEERDVDFDHLMPSHHFYWPSYIEGRNVHNTLLTLTMTNTSERSNIYHDSIKVPLFYTMNAKPIFRREQSLSQEITYTYIWYIRTITLTEYPLFLDNITFIDTTFSHEFQYSIEMVCIFYSEEHSEHFDVELEYNEVVDLLKYQILSNPSIDPNLVVHCHQYMYTIFKAHIQALPHDELIVYDFEFELKIEQRVVKATTNFAQCDSNDIIEPEIEYFENLHKTSNRIPMKNRRLETKMLVISTDLLKHYHLVALIPKEIILVERMSCDGCFIWTAKDVIQITHDGENIADYSTIIIYEVYRNEIGNVSTSYSGKPIFISKIPLYYSCSASQTFNLLCMMISPTGDIFDTEASMFERFSMVLTGNPYKSQAVDDPRNELKLKHYVL